MDFQMKRRAGLGLHGHSRTAEASSKEVLQKVKQERAARLLERSQQKSAVRLQASWRGSVERQQMRTRLLHDWLQQHSARVAAPQAGVASSQETLTAEELASNVLPPVLLCYLPASNRSRQTLQEGAPLARELLAEPGPLRGCFALLLRSLSSSSAEHNLLAWAAAGAAESKAQGAARIGLLRRLILLCCSAICASSSGETRAIVNGGSPSHTPDVLTAIAASRLVALMCDVQHWKWCASGTDSEPAQWLQQQLLHWLAPLALLSHAARRVTAMLEQQQEDSGTIVDRQLASVLSSLVLSQLCVWQQLRQLTAEGGSIAKDTALAEAAAGKQIVAQLLAVPHLLHHLPRASGGAAAALAEPATYTALLEAAACYGCGSNGRDRPSAADCLWVLASLAQLAAGGTQAGAGSTSSDRSPARFLAPSRLLRQPGVAAALAVTTGRLVNSAAAAQPGGAAVAAGVALEQLWPYAEASFAVQLLEPLSTPQFCSTYHDLLLLADDLGPSSSSVSRQGGTSPAATGFSTRLLHSLAFGAAPQLLPRLWRWMAGQMGLPLEAPMQATRGWEVASLRGGIQSLSQQHAEQLGLFCRVYCHALLVCDDHEFHEQQPLLSLAQQRAVAAAVNTLVFRTQLPASSPVAAAGRVQTGRSWRMLKRSAPLLHRALYERDARRQFCPPALWLEPYTSLMAAQPSLNTDSGVTDMSTAAVVRVLLAQAGDGGAGPQQGAAADSGAASRPAAVARILLTAPQCVPFEQRVDVFRALVEADKQRCGYELAPVDGGARPLSLTIRRSYLLEDAVALLSNVDSGIKRRLHVRFVSQQGHEEAGVDMGGLTKELLEGVVAAGLDQRRGLFSSTPEGFAFPNPLAERLDGGLATLFVVGLILGRALYDGVLLECPLAPFLVSRLQGRPPLFDELQALDPDVYRSLLQLKQYDGPIEDLALDFTVESEVLGMRTCEELVAGGSSIPVTATNRLQYIHLLADWHLNKRLGAAAAAFGRGLSQVIPPAWLRLFSAAEVNQLLGGGEGGCIDVADLETHTQYSGGYEPTSSAVRAFWAVVRGMSEADRRALLKFATSTSRAPLGGFKHLSPPLTIHKVDCGASLLAHLGGRDVDRLPTASTCHNMLKLPNFRRQSTLREKLLTAIHANAGFDLS